MDVEAELEFRAGFLKAAKSPNASSRAALFRHLADRPDDLYYLGRNVGVNIPYTQVKEYIAALDKTYPVLQ